MRISTGPVRPADKATERWRDNPGTKQVEGMESGLGRKNSIFIL